MSGDGRWFVLFPTSRTPRTLDAQRALEELASARIASTGRGAFTLTFRGRLLSVGLETKHDVLVESADLAARLPRLDGGTREYLSKCEHRYAFAYELGHAAELLGLLAGAAAKLRALTGGMILDASALRVVEPPLDPSALADDPSQAVARSLDVLADGGWAPLDLTFEHFATSAHTTTITSAKVNGEVEIRTTSAAHPVRRGSVAVEHVRAAAKALVESGFPDVHVPPGAPIPPPTVPPVRVAVRRGDARILGEVSAAQLDLVPKFQTAVHEVYGLGASARQGADAAKAAVQRLAEGAPPGALTIETTFVADATRRFRLRLESNGSLVEEELAGSRAKETILGAALPEERRAIAHALLDAGFPVAHGRALVVTEPHYVFRVAHGMTSVDVTAPAEALGESPLEATLRALYAAASRFGPRPLTLEDEPAVAPTVIAPQLLDFVNKRISFAMLARWLAEHHALWVPAAALSDGAYAPRIDRSSGEASIAVCTSEAALDQWFARYGAGAPRIAMKGTSGASLFGEMPEFIARVDIDAASPLMLQVRGEPLLTLRSVARAVAVERAASGPVDASTAVALLDHTFRVAWRKVGVSPSGVASEAALLVGVPGSRGELLAAAFTADDCADAYFLGGGGGRAGVTMGAMTGRELFASLGFLRMEGVSLNPSGPGLGAVLTKEACTSLLAGR